MAGIGFCARMNSSACQRGTKGAICRGTPRRGIGVWQRRNRLDSFAMRSSALWLGSAESGPRFLDTSDVVNAEFLLHQYPYKGAYRLIDPSEPMYLQGDASLLIKGSPQGSYRVPGSLAWVTTVSREQGGLFALCIQPENGPIHLPVLPLMEKVAQGLGQRLRMGFRHTFPELFIIFKSWANIQSKGPVREGEQVVLWAEFNAANSKPKFDPKGSTLGILAPLSFRGFSLGMAPVEDVSKVPLGPENQIFQFDARAAISTKDFELVENRKKIDQEQGSFGEVSKIPESTEKLEAKFRSRYPNDDQRPFWGFDHLLDVRNEYGVPLAMKRYDEGWSVFNDHMGFASGVSLMEALGQRLAEEGMSVRHKNLSPGYFGHFRWVSAEKVNFNNIVIPGDTVITDIGELSVEEVDSAAGTFDVVTPRATMYLPRSKETVGQFAKERSVLDLLNLRLRLWMPPA